MPAWGIKLTIEKEKGVAEVVRSLAGVPRDTLMTVRQALAQQILYLEDVAEWACGETEQARVEQLEQAVLAYFAFLTASQVAARRQVDWCYAPKPT